ncbi:Tn3 family transposase (plasmid) [Streptomyces sp. NBC_00012]|uniref:Tn3 family transposase n=1 Tax=Streptomyces sp. NBC_00012 TaxID=2975621 RepID=UPI002F90C4CB
MTSNEPTAYPRFKRLITAHELYLFFSPTRDELAWVSDATDCDEHLLALLLMLKSYQRMGCFPKLEDVPEQVVEFVRRQVELPEGTLPVYQAEKTAKNHRGVIRKRVGVLYDQAQARRIAEQSIRKEAAAKNRPADLINIALEKVVEAGLELLAFSTFDAMASKVRREVNTATCDGIHGRISPAERAGLLRLLEEREADGTTLFNRLKKPAQGPSWSHFKRLTSRLEWVDGLGDTDVWMEGVASGKITDFAGEADAADVAELRDYKSVKRLALVACLVHKARMRVRDDLATMFCKRVATEIKKAKQELEEIRLAEREIVEALIGNYRTVLKLRNAAAAADAGYPDNEGLVIDWDLIESQFRHLMRVAVSVREGAISSSALLKRLRSGSKKNATYTAFREVGRVIRTVQLLRYLSDAPLRRRVTAATNKVESFNRFSQWIGFGNRGVIADNRPGRAGEGDEIQCPAHERGDFS